MPHIVVKFSDFWKSMLPPLSTWLYWYGWLQKIFYQLQQIVPGNLANCSQWGLEERITFTLLENVCFLAVSEWIRGFCDLLRKNLTSFSIFLECNLISTASLMSHSMQLDFLARIQVLLGTIQGQCHVLPQLTPPYHFNIQSDVFSHPDDGGGNI